MFLAAIAALYVTMSVCRLVGQLVGWSVGRLVGRSVGRLVSWADGRLFGWSKLKTEQNV